MGVKAHRAKLGLCADNYGKLVGVSGVTIYKWETGKNKPQEAQKAKWLAIRGLGKEEALDGSARRNRKRHRRRRRRPQARRNASGAHSSRPPRR